MSYQTTVPPRARSFQEAWDTLNLIGGSGDSALELRDDILTTLHLQHFHYPLFFFSNNFWFFCNNQHVNRFIFDTTEHNDQWAEHG